MPKVFIKHLATPEHLLPPHQPGTVHTPTVTPNHVVHEELDDDDPLKIFLTWRAPARPFRAKDRSYYTTIAIIVVLLCLILLLAQQLLLIAAVLSLTFVAYVLSFIPPEDMDYKISNQGITIGEHFYIWHDLDSFWFDTKEGHKILKIYTYLTFPTLLILPLGDVDVEVVRKIISRYIIFLEVAPKSTMDKWADILERHFPLEMPKS
jgi:hypothetical protein